MTRQAGLLWLAMVLGSAHAVAADTVLADSVQAIRTPLSRGDIEAAIAAGERAIEARAQDAQAWFWLGRAYAQQAMRAGLLSKPKWAGKTRDAYQQAVTLDPEHLDARHDLMQYYVMAPGILGGDSDKALEQQREIARRDAVMGKLASATLAQHDDRSKEAETLAREALALDPARARSRISLSLLLAGDERWAEIRTLWDEVLARDPEDRLAHYQLGRLAAISGEQPDAGLAHIDRYLAAPEQSDYMSEAGGHWRRGQLLEKLGRRDEALQAYERAVALQPTLEPAKKDLERLRG
jgi:tetratricopeptide (TPR) repeat protein